MKKFIRHNGQTYSAFNEGKFWFVKWWKDASGGVPEPDDESNYVEATNIVIESEDPLDAIKAAVEREGWA